MNRAYADKFFETWWKTMDQPSSLHEMNSWLFNVAFAARFWTWYHHSPRSVPQK